MPGLDGLETLRRIKGRAPGGRVIMVTAYASIELAVEAMKLGSSDFVRKPMTPETVRDAVAAALAKPSSPVPAAGVKELEAPPRTLIEHVTMNGFSYVDAPGSEDSRPLAPNERRFIVKNPRGLKTEVIVEIDPRLESKKLINDLESPQKSPQLPLAGAVGTSILSLSYRIK
jgi:chemotaxis response regulator CheB